jgi:hypothetical protein
MINGNTKERQKTFSRLAKNGIAKDIVTVTISLLLPFMHDW